MHLKNSVERRMTNIENALDRKMIRIVDQTTELAKTNANSWQLPFIFLVVVISAAGAGLYYFYRKLQKMHLL